MTYERVILFILLVNLTTEESPQSSFHKQT